MSGSRAGATLYMRSTSQVFQCSESVGFVSASLSRPFPGLGPRPQPRCSLFLVFSLFLPGEYLLNAIVWATPFLPLQVYSQASVLEHGVKGEVSGLFPAGQQEWPLSCSLCPLNIAWLTIVAQWLTHYFILPPIDFQT